ncbi:MAG: hypothetical protein Q4A23_03215 [bacterium]|nr:hypothetical protein [bacterium]
MEDKYISKEVFAARIDVLEEKINSLTQIVEHTNDQLEIIAGISKSVTEHQKDIESVRRETERNKDRLRRLEENQSKIVWAVGLAILGAFIQFVISGGLMIHK